MLHGMCWSTNSPPATRDVQVAVRIRRSSVTCHTPSRHPAHNARAREKGSLLSHALGMFIGRQCLSCMRPPPLTCGCTPAHSARGCSGRPPRTFRPLTRICQTHRAATCAAVVSKINHILCTCRLAHEGISHEVRRHSQRQS